MPVIVTDEMLDAVVVWYNERVGDGPLEIPIGQFCTEIYLVMETVRRKRLQMEFADKVGSLIPVMGRA